MLWLFLQGYAIIEIQAANIDKALFRISKAGIELIGVSRVSYTRLQATVRRREFMRLQQVVSGSGSVAVHTIGGTWKLLHTMKRHLVLLAGLLTVAVLMLYLSNCCLYIEVSGNERISEYAIREVAKENGIQLYRLRKREVLKQIETALWEAFPELSYAYAAYHGAGLRIDVREKYQAPEIASAEPSAVYAARDGVVTQITVHSGKAMVQAGDRVQKGDLLIAGAYMLGERCITTHAAGTVTGQITAVDSALLTEEQISCLRPTGNTAQGYCMRIGRREYVLQGEDPFSLSLNEQETVARMGRNGPLSLEIVKIVWQEAEYAYSAQKKNAALLELQEEAYASLRRKLDETADIYSIEIFEEQTTEGLKVVCTLRAQTELGMQGPVNVIQTETSERIYKEE